MSMLIRSTKSGYTPLRHVAAAYRLCPTRVSPSAARFSSGGLAISAVRLNSSVSVKDLFDDSKFFKNFNKEASSPFLGFGGSSSQGLFKNEFLKDPQGLVNFSETSLTQAKSLVESMLEDVHTTAEGKLTYIRKLDQLSDILCRVIDLAEFIRVCHPRQTWVDAAQQTHEMMFEYMNQLNTNVELYANLKNVLADKAVLKRLTDEEIQVGEYLKQDFERSGIHMDDDIRSHFVSLTQQISLLGSQFSNEIHNLEAYWCEIDKAEFDQINDEDTKKVIYGYQFKAPVSRHGRGKTISIPLAGDVPYHILTNCHVESIRKKVWVSLHNSTGKQLSDLNEFIKLRAVLARMLGYESFAHYQLEHKMAKTPENVVAFLTKIQKTLLEKPDGVVDEVKSLYKFKPNADFSNSDKQILREVKPWDRDYLVHQSQIANDQGRLDPDHIKQYLSVGTVMSGLSQLFESIYGVRLTPVKTTPGETWDNNQVRKLNVFDVKQQKTLGYLYIDFWSPKAFPSHFTIVCSRKLNQTIGTETSEQLAKEVPLDESKECQLPVISLVCNFSKPYKDHPTLLSLDQVDTVFHEMGHAMHSMIGRTELQNLSGTRCHTDFVELPSVLMESFSHDPRVLCKIAKHYKTGEPLSEELLQQYQSERVVLEESEKYMQSKMAMLDQKLHNHEVVEAIAGDYNGFNSTHIYHKLERQLQVFVDDCSTWHGRFPHLFSYGAVYYSYLLDRAIAERVWEGLFAADPWSSEAGDKYKNSILKWGGTRDPWVCLADALDNEELRNGDYRAMEIIGQKL